MSEQADIFGHVDARNTSVKKWQESITIARWLLLFLAIFTWLTYLFSDEPGILTYATMAFVIVYLLSFLFIRREPVLYLALSSLVYIIDMSIHSYGQFISLVTGKYYQDMVLDGRQYLGYSLALTIKIAVLIFLLRGLIAARKYEARAKTIRHNN